MKLRLWWLGVLGLSLLGSAGSARAIQGIGISPTSQELTAVPGTVTHGELTVINDGDSDVMYRIYATDYHVNDETYQGEFSSSGAAANVSAVTWFSLPKGVFTVKAREQSKAAYTITVPRTATVGGHYAAVFVETVPPAGRAGTYISRVERVGSIFYLSTGGDVHQAGQTLPLNVPWLQAVSPLRATLRVRNSGNVHFAAEGTAQLATPFGKSGSALPFRGEVLPGTTRRFELKLPAASPIGLYRVEVKVQYMGRTEVLSHWVLLMPRLTFMVVGGTVILLLVLGFWGLMRRARRR